MIILGGGALGLETALAIKSGGAAVSVIDHNVGLLRPLLDDQASRLLGEKIQSLGIHLYLSHGIQTIFGVEKVTGVRLWQGEQIECDSVVLATGVKAHVTLAKAAGLKIGQGILVDDCMQSSAPDIYAVGECAQHRGKIYRLVAPGLQQAAVAAEAILGRDARYKGSVPSTQLKNIDTPVFSMGAVEEADSRFLLRNLAYQNKANGIYRKLVREKGRLVGLIALGEWPELSRLQKAVEDQARISWLQGFRFLQTGNVFGWRAAKVRVRTSFFRSAAHRLI